MITHLVVDADVYADYLEWDGEYWTGDWRGSAPLTTLGW